MHFDLLFRTTSISYKLLVVKKYDTCIPAHDKGYLIVNMMLSPILNNLSKTCNYMYPKIKEYVLFIERLQIMINALDFYFQIRAIEYDALQILNVYGVRIGPFVKRNGVLVATR